MSSVIGDILDTASFVPHGYCLLWRPDLVVLHVASDSLIALAYFSIPLTLVNFVRVRTDLQFKWIFVMFACFITACGLTHIADTITLWQPYYGVQAILKLVCAVVSVGTAIATWRLIPHVIALPSPSQLRIANARLQAEVRQRIGAQQAATRAASELEMRVEDLDETNRRLQHEVAERARAEAELRRAFALLDEHVTNTPLAVIEWVQDRAEGSSPRIRRWSGCALAIFGWTDAEVQNCSADELGLIHEADVHRATETGRDLESGRKRQHGLSLRCYTKDRRIRHCQWYNSVIHHDDSDTTTTLSLVEDVTERVTALEDVYRLAHHDPLTGLPNRLMLQDRLSQAIASAPRHREGVAVMMLDLDHFKNVNDALGHQVGDRLLAEVAKRLRAALRRSDTLARIGGDEFVLVQSTARGARNAAIMANKLLQVFRQSFDIQGHRLHVSGSIGVTLFPDDGADADTLLRNADMALYKAKREARGVYRFYTPDMDFELKAMRSVENGLRTAIEQGALELFYQRTFAIEDLRPVGVEALVRWRHPKGGTVLPAEFIPVAELSGLIVPLGEWVLREACQQARTWWSKGQRLRVAVNLSAIQLRQRNFANVVERTLAEYGLATTALELEVTESIFLDPSRTAITDTLCDLAASGVRLAIDDFGTGFSSLAYLKHFPFDRIKIDGSFVQDIGTSKESEAIIASIIALSRNLGKAVTAECVETRTQLDFLMRNSCNEAQGFFLSAPQPSWKIN